MERPRVHADRHLESYGPRRGREAAHPGQGVLHPESRSGRPVRVVLAPEEQEHGIAAELEQVGVVGIGRLDQLREGGVEYDGDLLRTFTAPLRELLGQLGEARDVGKDERALERAGKGRRGLAQPVGREPGNEGTERVVRRSAPRSRRGARHSLSLPGASGESSAAEPARGVEPKQLATLIAIASHRSAAPHPGGPAGRLPYEHAPVAQGTERRTSNPRVGGSNPPGRTVNCLPKADYDPARDGSNCRVRVRSSRSRFLELDQGARREGPDERRTAQLT